MYLMNNLNEESEIILKNFKEVQTQSCIHSKSSTWYLVYNL